MIWLQLFDDDARGRGKPLHEFRCFERVSALRDREIGILGFRDPVAVSKGRRKNVQATSDCVDIGPRLDIERERKSLFEKRHTMTSFVAGGGASLTTISKLFGSQESIRA